MEEINDKIIEFKCVPEYCTYDAEDYKIYATNVDKKEYPNIKLNTRKNVTILGNIHKLGIGIEYYVKSKEQESKYGYQYHVVNIKRDRPTNIDSSRLFLEEIITPNQVKVLLKVYPDIIDRVINERLDDINLQLTKGIKEYTFGVIKRKIIENFKLVEIVDEFKGLLTISTLKKLYEKYPSVKKIKSELRKNPYHCLCSLSRIGFKKADSILLEINNFIDDDNNKIIEFEENLKTSYQRAKAFTIYCLEENEKNGNTKMLVKNLRPAYEKEVPECMHHLVKILKEDKDVYFSLENKCIALQDTYETEQYIAQEIINGLNIKNKWDIDINKYIKIKDDTLTDQQAQALKYMRDYNIFILNGFAGSGKSFTTKAIINMLDDNFKSYKLLAPTGRAAKVLSGYTERDASTIHRGLGFMPPFEWGYNSKNKLHENVVIIDEFSMTDIFLFKRLLEAIDFSRTKLLIIGDSAQIPSVGAGNILFDFVHSNKIPIVTLDKIFRYGKGGLMTVATNTRLSKQFIDDDEIKLKIFGEDKSYVYIPVRQEKIMPNLKGLYTKLLSDGYRPQDILILSSYNIGDYGTIKINNEIQAIANPNVQSEKGLKHGDIIYYKNDLVIQCVNNYKAKIYNEKELKTFIPNGEIGYIDKMESNYIVIQFDDEKIIYTKSEMNQIKLAYAISTHKSQGGQCKIVILLTPKAHTYMLNSNLIYVGQTRAKEKCFHMGEPFVINRAIKKKANFDRKTFLKQLLLETTVSDKLEIKKKEKEEEIPF